MYILLLDDDDDLPAAGVREQPHSGGGTSASPGVQTQPTEEGLRTVSKLNRDTWHPSIHPLCPFPQKIPRLSYHTISPLI